LTRTQRTIQILRDPQEVFRWVKSVQTNADLAKDALGFLPAQAYDQAAKQGTLFVAVNRVGDDARYAGHILFGATYPHPEKIPRDFAKDFRQCRNKVSTHVSHERSALSLSNFYDQYHKYLGLLYHDAKGWWGHLDDEFPDLSEITAFSVLIRDTQHSTS
jgi:hypothetical protein